jgi:hypothetical protein
MNKKIPEAFKVIGRSAVIWWDALIQLALMNFVLVLCMLTIVPGPPAWFGLFDAVMQLVKGESPTLKDWFKGTKHYFAKSWLWFLGNLFVLSVVYANIMFYERFNAGWTDYAQILFIALGIFWVFLQFFSVPYVILMEKESLLLAWKNGLFTMLAYPGYTFIIILVMGIVLFGGGYVVLPLILGGLSFVIVLACVAVRNRVLLIQRLREEKEPADEQNGDEPGN